MRTADDELPCRVDVENEVVAEDVADVPGDLCFDTGYEDLLDVAADGVEHAAVGFVL